jgi:hypothetical protein
LNEEPLIEKRPGQHALLKIDLLSRSAERISNALDAYLMYADQLVSGRVARNDLD